MHAAARSRPSHSYFKLSLFLFLLLTFPAFRKHSIMMTLNSPPSSPLLSSRSPTRHIPLRLPDVANLIVKLRRHSRKAQDTVNARAYPIHSSSGEPKTHPALEGDDKTSERKIPLVEERRFLCKGGVDVKKLLRTMRATLLEEAQSIGAHVLVEEQ